MSPSVGPTDTITTDQLRVLRNDPTLRILDVRTGGEFETVHIPGSYNVPLDTLSEHASELADVDHPVVLVCQSGGRATTAGKQLSAAGKQTLHILEGGMIAWTAAGGDVVRTETNRWAMDRQVRLLAGSIVLLSVLASLVLPELKWGAAFIGAGLMFSAVTNTCAMAQVLGRLSYNRGKGCDINGVLADLRSPEGSVSSAAGT
jgi:rhodanese-related sulfurtransferase